MLLWQTAMMMSHNLWVLPCMGTSSIHTGIDQLLLLLPSPHTHLHGCVAANLCAVAAAAAGCPLLTSVNQHRSSALVVPARQQLSARLAAHGRHIKVPELHGLLHETVQVGCADPLRFAPGLLWLMRANIIITLVVCQHNNEVGALACRQSLDARALWLWLWQGCRQHTAGGGGSGSRRAV